MRPLPEPRNLVDHCRELARARGDAPAYTWLRDGEEEEATLTFAGLDARARAIGAELERRGLTGERVLLAYSPGLEFIAAFLGCLYAGAVAVPLSPPHGERAAATLAGIARHAGAALLLADARTLAATPDARAFLGVAAVLASDGIPAESGRGWRPSSPDPDRLAFLQYTSGSTGAPKGVRMSHANLIRNEEMIRAAFGHDEGTLFVGWLPLFHDMGLVGNVLQPLFLGVRCVLMAPAAFVQRPARWLAAISRYRATTSGSPNFGYELCAQRVRAEHVAGLDLSCWKVAYNGSEPVRAATLERFAARFAPLGLRREALYPCYGMAEAALFVTGGVAGRPYARFRASARALADGRAEPAHDAEARELVSCGRAWLDQEVRIVEPATRAELGQRNVGEIWIRGGNVASGYHALAPGADDPFRAFLASGEGPFFRTGDLGFLERGELYVTGRSKDVLIHKGRKLYPQDVELSAGASHPFLRADHGAAFAIQPEHDVQYEQERLVIAQEVHRRYAQPLEQGGAAGEALRSELVGAIRAAVAREHGISVWRVALLAHGALPRTTSGKVQRALCRALWLRGELAELGPHEASVPVLSHDPRTTPVNTTP